ncbi:MAG: sigma-70 family RNA polymerase sigma factor [Acidobacteria bacterium]|nr:sigma-70 family RNA polymerase sigma factor [Acidobacteriota bacterium]
MDALQTVDKTALFNRFYRPVLALLRGRLYCPDDAEDLAQETFRLGFLKLDAGELKDAAAIGGFFAGIARNLALNQNRSRQRWHSEAEPTLQNMPSEALSPLDSLLTSELQSLVQTLLRELKPERDRQILTAFFLHQRDKKEICAEWALDAIHFNRVIHRAKVRFRALLEKKGMGLG